jgi:cell division cycle protein 20 (cofactor of APC complex)
LLSKKSLQVDNSSTRNISLVPEKILDAPELRDDYYLNLMDWSNSGQLAIGLDKTVYLYTPTEISELSRLPEGYVCSISFHTHNPVVGIGNSLGNIEIYDLERRTLLRTMKGHLSRVSSLSFSSLIYSGSKDTMIHGYDIKSPNPIVMKFEGHKGEVCGLKQSPSGLASGSNDNLAMVWDITMGRARHVLSGHKAAVKAIAWCPWQRNLLATGGGTTDKCMRFWDVDTGKCLKTVNTESQVCSLIWNKNEREILSSHGYSNNQLCVWTVILHFI